MTVLHEATSSYRCPWESIPLRWTLTVRVHIDHHRQPPRSIQHSNATVLSYAELSFQSFGHLAVSFPLLIMSEPFHFYDHEKKSGFLSFFPSSLSSFPLSTPMRVPSFFFPFMPLFFFRHIIRHPSFLFGTRTDVLFPTLTAPVTPFI